MSVSEVGRFPLQTAYKPPNPLDAVWAAYFGLFYRKFFWDFVSGTLRDPGGLQCVNHLRSVFLARADRQRP